MKIIKDQWLATARQVDFDEAVRREVNRMPASDVSELMSNLLLKLVDNDTLTVQEVLDLLGVDWDITPE